MLHALCFPSQVRPFRFHHRTEVWLKLPSLVSCPSLALILLVVASIPFDTDVVSTSSMASEQFHRQRKGHDHGTDAATRVLRRSPNIVHKLLLLVRRSTLIQPQLHRGLQEVPPCSLSHKVACRSNGVVRRRATSPDPNCLSKDHVRTSL